MANKYLLQKRYYIYRNQQNLIKYWVMSIVRKNNLVFPALMNDIFKPDWFGGLENNESFIPAVNILDNEASFELELFVPGRKREDFNVEIDEQLMTI